MLNHPDFNRLKVFYYIFTGQSIVRAAEALNISQSAVSQQLKKLEAELETSLFIRLHKRLIPTSEAQRIFSILEPFIYDLELSLRLIKQSKGEPSGEMRIGSPHGFGKAYLPKIISRFRKKYPKVTFKLWLGDANKILSMLDNGQLDLALIDEYLIQRMLPGVLNKYCFENVIQEELILAGSKKYCEERLQEDYSYENLIKQDFISCHLDALAVTNWFGYHYGKLSIKLNIVLETDSFQSVMEGIKNHLGLSVTASHLVREQLKTGTIISIPTPKKATLNRISLARFQTKVPNLTEKAFLSHFKSEIARQCSHEIEAHKKIDLM